MHFPKTQTAVPIIKVAQIKKTQSSGERSDPHGLLVVKAKVVVNIGVVGI